MTVSASLGMSLVVRWFRSGSHRTCCSQYESDCPLRFGNPVLVPLGGVEAYSSTFKVALDTSGTITLAAPPTVEFVPPADFILAELEYVVADTYARGGAGRISFGYSFLSTISRREDLQKNSQNKNRLMQLIQVMILGRFLGV